MAYAGQKYGNVLKATLTWTSAADGTATQATPELYGILRRVAFIPGTGGTQPTNLYDLTLTTPAAAGSIDVLAAQGANLANNANTHVCPGVPLKDGTTTSVTPPLVSDVLTLNVTNAGDSKTGTVILYVETLP